MGLRINTNVAAINAHRNLGITDSKMSQAMERLSSGYRVNRAKDDAAGLAQSQSLKAQSMSLSVAGRNTTQANAMLQTAEGGADQIHNMLLRLKELATQAASANSNSNLTDINNEAGKLSSEIERIAQSTKYLGESMLTGYGTKSLQTGLACYSVDNVYAVDVSGAGQGSYLISGAAAGTSWVMWNSAASGVSQTVTVASGAQTINFSTFGIKFSTSIGFTTADNSVSGQSAFGSGVVVTGTTTTFQVGQTNNANFQISFQLDSLSYTSLGTTGKTINSITLTSLTNAQCAMNWIDVAIDQVNTSRAEIGALQNRLDYTYANIQTTIENISAAESVIRDADMAAEMVTFTKTQILMQAGTAMLGQANAAPQNILSILGR